MTPIGTPLTASSHGRLTDSDAAVRTSLSTRSDSRRPVCSCTMQRNQSRKDPKGFCWSRSWKAWRNTTAQISGRRSSAGSERAPKKARSPRVRFRLGTNATRMTVAWSLIRLLPTLSAKSSGCILPVLALQTCRWHYTSAGSEADKGKSHHNLLYIGCSETSTI